MAQTPKFTTIFSHNDLSKLKHTEDGMQFSNECDVPLNITYVFYKCKCS